MRAFIILAVIVAAANADVSHLVGQGYGYGPVKTVSGGLVGGSKTILTGGGLIGSSGLVGGGLIGGGRLVSSNLVQPATTTVVSNGGLIGGGLVGGQIIGGQVVGGGLVGGSSIVGGGIVGGSGSVIRPGTTTVVGLDAVDSIPPTVEYSKQVFYFSAPEEEQQTGVVQQQLSNVLKKNLQVVFIKAPENAAATNAALQLAKQAIEQRTAIYVLSKENDANTIVGQLAQIQENVQTAPEVRIVKYRTPEDLAYATQIIKEQYNDIGGPSAIINGGEAPVLNYASGKGAVNTVNVLGAGSGLVGGINNLGGVGVVNTVNKVVGTSGLGGVQVVGGINKVVSGSSSGYLPPHLRK